MKGRIIQVLLRIYSAAWRKKYGPELHDILERRHLLCRTVFNVAWNAAWQRIRATEPWVLLGVVGLLLNATGFAWLILVPPPYRAALEFPPEPALFSSLTSLLVVMGCGFWTVARSGGTLPHAGVQAMKMTLLSISPAIVVCALVMTGVLGVIVLGPGDSPTTVSEHGFAITSYSAERVEPNSLTVLLIMSVGVLGNWFWGAVGGAFGRLVRRGSQASA